mgnify:CR=1 FL=1
MGRLISQKNKSKVIRAFRTPSAPVVMSLMALILIIGAPALVSVIDDSMSSQVMTKISFEDEDNLAITYVDTSGVWQTGDKLASLYPSMNDGSYFYTVSNPADATSVKMISIHSLAPTEIPDFNRMTITIDGDQPTSSYFSVNSTTSSTTHPRYNIDAIESNPGVWVIDADSIDRAKLGASQYDTWSIMIIYDGGLTTGSTVMVETYTASTIAYGEIIVGATGVLLIVCAILATPWVGTTGLTIKRRR